MKRLLILLAILTFIACKNPVEPTFITTIPTLPSHFLGLWKVTGIDTFVDIYSNGTIVHRNNDIPLQIICTWTLKSMDIKSNYLDSTVVLSVTYNSSIFDVTIKTANWDNLVAVITWGEPYSSKVYNKTGGQ